MARRGRRNLSPPTWAPYPGRVLFHRRPTSVASVPRRSSPHQHTPCQTPWLFLLCFANRQRQKETNKRTGRTAACTTEWRSSWSSQSSTGRAVPASASTCPHTCARAARTAIRPDDQPSIEYWREAEIRRTVHLNVTHPAMRADCVKARGCTIGGCVYQRDPDTLRSGAESMYSGVTR